MGLRVFLCLLAVLAVSPTVSTQEARKASYVVGEVTAREASQVTLKTDQGAALIVTLVPGAPILKTKPGSKTLEEASAISLAEVAIGDRVMIHGFQNGSAVDGRKLVVMTRGEIAEKHEAERAEWRKRGIAAIVTAVASGTGEIRVRVGRRADAASLVIDAKSATLKRYAADSVKFADARPGTLQEIQAGDELRAMGDKSPDGSRLTAEKVVTGSFLVITGAVVSIDPEKSDLQLKDDASQKVVRVTVGPDARLRHLPAEMAQRFGARPEGARPEGAPRPGMRAFNPEDLLERLPAVTLPDLKTGDRVLVSSTRGADASRMNAIVLVSGLEAIPTPRRSGRGAEVGLPGDLMDLGLSLP